MAAVLVIIKAILEVAAFALIAQGLVGIFAWDRRADNPIYQLLVLVASPFTRLVRWSTPKAVLDRHIPLATLLLLAFGWLLVLIELRSTCLADPTQRACPALVASAPAR